MMSALIIFMVNNENCIHMFISWVKNKEIEDN